MAVVCRCTPKISQGEGLFFRSTLDVWALYWRQSMHVESIPFLCCYRCCYIVPYCYVYGATVGLGRERWTRPLVEEMRSDFLTCDSNIYIRFIYCLILIRSCKWPFLRCLVILGITASRCSCSAWICFLFATRMKYPIRSSWDFSHLLLLPRPHNL